MKATLITNAGSLSGVVNEAYIATYSNVYGEKLARLARVASEAQFGCYETGDVSQFRAAVYCPSFEFSDVLNSMSRAALAAKGFANDEVFSETQPFDARSERLFFCEDWNGFLEVL